MLVIDMSGYEKEKLKKLSEELNCSMNFLCRAMLNAKMEEVSTLGVKEYSIELKKIKESDKRVR